MQLRVGNRHYGKAQSWARERKLPKIVECAVDHRGFEEFAALGLRAEAGPSAKPSRPHGLAESI